MDNLTSDDNESLYDDNALAETTSDSDLLASMLAVDLEAVPDPVPFPAFWPSEIPLVRISSSSTILIVGDRRSGRTTLLKALLKMNNDRGVIVFDSNPTLGKWSLHAEVIGGVRQFGKIYQGISQVERILHARSMYATQVAIKDANFIPFVVASDEWKSITLKCEDELFGDEEATSSLIESILSEGRHYKIGFFATAEDDTIEGLGCEGNQVTFTESFDWIIYMGGFAVDRLRKHFPDTWRNIPYITNSEGGIVPVVVPAWSAGHYAWCLLNVMELDKVQQPIGPRFTLDDLERIEDMNDMNVG